MEKTRVLVTVKTYPTLSKNHGELVCTAGGREDGSWVRMYPVPFRRIEDYEKRYSKYQWISVELVKRKGDSRPESFTPNLESLEAGEIVETGKARDWAARKDLVLARGIVHQDMSTLIACAHANTLSLATFKPTEVMDVIVEETEREWDPRKLEHIENLLKQPDLFEDERLLRKQFTLVDKLPYDFSYRFRDSAGKESTLQIIDWEIGALYWNCLRRADSEKEALRLVKQKYLEEFGQRDLHFFLGTTREFHSWGKNPFLICGTFTPPKTDQLELGLY